MASNLEGVKKSTLTDEMRKTLCEYKNALTRHKLAKYPELEKVLYEWFLQYQEKVNLTGEMIQTKAKEFLQKMYGDANSEFNFSSNALPQIRAKLKIFDWQDIYNMDETGLFYHLQAGYEKGELNLENINVLDAIHFINEDMPLEQEIVISDLHYRNAIDVEQILNYQSENESLMELPTNEEIIQGVMDVSADDEQDPYDSSVLLHVSLKEVFLDVDTLKNYAKGVTNISDLVYALLKVKDEIVFESHVKNKQLTIDAYFSKE
ncbi:hypothetical protein ES288_A11G335400v1 [Gossypium darwinii]|uniref:HTH CENPB-type domain-containing protein n=1 Tax=Gossypium darwinii TaxID=34276 RepID=A0A5D2ERR7_GOSDA|nr:hypothetical protein ES288_A11G335400v1 [Gossypium darwinii]